LEVALEIVQRMDGFLASVLYAMDGIHVVDDLPSPALTDSVTVSVARSTLDWSPDDLAFALAHEAGHVIGRHAMRRGDRDGARWNLACDKAINRAIRTQFPFSRPEDIFIDTSADARSEEELYEAEKGSQCPQCFVPAPDSAKARAVAKRVRDVINAARKAGKNGGLLASLPVEDARLPLPHIMATVLARGRDEYSFRRPSRASRACGVYLPSLSERALVGTVMISLDTSGSMSDNEIARGMGGIVREAKRARIARLVVVQQDTEVAIVYDGPPSGYVPKKMMRGGGTDFRPLMTLARKIKPRLLAVITDLEGTHGKAPGCRVVWITSSSPSGQPPFGTVCRF
jgi:predicted metal-dependent peptidase